MASSSSALIVLLVVAVALVLLNVFVTLAVLKSSDLRTGQKITQCMLVWLVPLVGALLALHILRESAADPLMSVGSPQSDVNLYVSQSLGFQARAANRATRQQLEDTVVESISGSGSSSGAAAD